MSKKKKKLFQKRKQKSIARKLHKKKKQLFELKIKRIIKKYNRVRYRTIPGMPGKYPYALSPIGREEAIQILHTGHFTRKSINMNVLSKGGGEIKMTEERTAKLAELEADTEKTATESALFEALTALKASEEAVSLAEDALAKEEAAAKETATTATPAAPANGEGEAKPAA